MKRVLLFIMLLPGFKMFAQAPQKISFQAVVRNAGGAVVANTSVGMQISILKGVNADTVVYVERQTPATNTNGLVSIEIGNGQVQQGSFASINWSTGNYSIKTETDVEGGTNYTISGTTQFLSVPYALYAENTNNAAKVDAVADIAALQAYSGNATVLVVKDSARGGVFNYCPKSAIVDNGVTFIATGKDSGYWKRQIYDNRYNLKWWNVLGSNNSATNTANFRKAVVSVPKNAILYGDPSGKIKLQDSILINRPGFKGCNWFIETDINPATHQPYVFTMIAIAADSVTLQDIRAYGNGSLVSDDNNRRDALYWYKANWGHAERITGTNIKKDLVVFENGSHFTAKDITADSVNRDAVSIVKAVDVKIYNVTAKNSGLRGGVEISDSSFNAKVYGLYVENCAYAFDVQKHASSQRDEDVLFDGVTSIGNKTCMTLRASDSTTANWTFKNIYILGTTGNYLAGSGDIDIVARSYGLTMDNIVIVNPNHSNPLFQLQRSQNANITNIHFVSLNRPLTNQLMNIRFGLKPVTGSVVRGYGLTLDKIFCDNYQGASAAIVVTEMDNTNISGLNIRGTTSNTARLLDLINCSNFKVHDNILKGSSSYAIQHFPTTATYGSEIYNNVIDSTLGINFGGGLFTTYRVFGNTGPFTKTAKKGTPISLNFESPLNASVTVTLNFPATLTATSADLVVPFPGAVDGDMVVLGVPTLALINNTCYTAFVSSPDNITIRFNNYSKSTRDPPIGNFKVTILK